MTPLALAAPGERLRLLCLGAHADDIEIGCGGTVLQLVERGVRLEVDWCVLSASPVRAEEARASARASEASLAFPLTAAHGCQPLLAPGVRTGAAS